MAKKPELIKLSETEYGCSRGDWKTEAIKPERLTQAEWEARRLKQFEEHVRQRHAREDFSQAAGTIT
jgi:hypothetical protein